MGSLGPKELMANVRDAGLCVACGACAGICPYHKAYKGKLSMIAECDRDVGQCYDVCPMTETDDKALAQVMFNAEPAQTGIGHYQAISAARAGKEVRKGSVLFQNGGSVSALIMAALDTRMIDSAILTGKDGQLPIPKKINRAQDVISCTGSKYMATPTLEQLNQSIIAGGKRHGVVGTGCQMKAVAAMRRNSFEKEEYKDAIALSLGLFCTWSLDTRKFLNFLNSRIHLPDIVAMDVPPPPSMVFVIKTKAGEMAIDLDDIRPLIPKGCLLCPDMTAQWSDLSVGALEGKPGWNTLIIRSDRGKVLVDEAVAHNYLELDSYPAQSLERLTLAADKKLHRAEKNASKEAI